MVRVTQPLMAGRASGSLAQILTWAQCKGRNYVKRHRPPANPRTAKQQVMRIMMKFLRDHWSELSDADKATWHALAEGCQLPPYNVYIGVNMIRWCRLHAPSTTGPATETGAFQSSGYADATGGKGQVTLHFPINALHDGWGIAVKRNTIRLEPLTLESYVAIIPTPLPTDTYWIDSPLAPGTYYYYWQCFTKQGKLSPQYDPYHMSAVVT